MASSWPVLKTCQTCHRAKIRCDRSKNPTGPCDRCLRLNKECHFVPARRRNPPASRTRIERLEAKLDSLLVGGGAGASAGAALASPRSSSPRLQRRHSELNEASDADDGSFARNPSISVSTPTSEPDNAGSVFPEAFDAVANGMVALDRAEKCLAVFRTKFTPHFPFVVVSERVSFDELRRRKPALSLAILAVTSYEDFTLQYDLCRLFNKLVSRRLEAGHILSIELLQGLLVDLAW